MMVNVARLMAIFMILLTEVYAGTSQQSPLRLEAHGVTIDGVPIKATVKTITYSPTPDSKRDVHWWGTIDDGFATPNIIVFAVDIREGRMGLHVPLSAFADLSEPNEVSVASCKQGFTVIIRGGEAAASYEALLVFENGVIRRRKVVHMGFPDEAWEETHYSFTVNRPQAN